MLCNTFVMKISYNWLKDYVELRDKPDTLADILTDIGLEVDAVEVVPGLVPTRGMPHREVCFGVLHSDSPWLINVCT